MYDALHAEVVRRAVDGLLVHVGRAMADDTPLVQVVEPDFFRGQRERTRHDHGLELLKVLRTPREQEAPPYGPPGSLGGSPRAA